MAANKKVGVPFYAKIDTNKDLIGKAANFRLKYIEDSSGTVTDVDTDGSTWSEVQVGGVGIGIYTCAITISSAGDYTVIAENSVDGMQNIAFPVEVTAAGIDDIKALIDALQTDVTNINTQVDLLDEAELNGISEQITAMNTTVNNINTLIEDDSIADLVVSGDETVLFVPAANVTGDTSGATGVVDSSSFDGTNTIVVLTSSTGTFTVGETVNDGTNTTTGTVVGGGSNAINSVMEFVEAINNALTGGGSALDVLAGYTDNLELMLEGKQYVDTTGATVLEADSYGLSEIYAKITANGVDIAAANTALSDATTGLAAIKSAITTAQTSIEGKIDAQTTTIQTDIAAVQTVVDANKLTLEDSGYGLSALKTLLDNLSSDISLGFIGVDGRFDTIDTTLTNISDAITNQTTHLDSRLDDIENAIGGVASAQAFKGFV